MSSTGPVIWMIRPMTRPLAPPPAVAPEPLAAASATGLAPGLVPGFVAALAAGFFVGFAAATAMVEDLVRIDPGTLRGRLGARGDLDHLTGDVGLADLVIGEGVLIDELLGVLRRVLHRDHPGGLLRGYVLEHRPVQARRHVAREELLEHDGRGG